MNSLCKQNPFIKTGIRKLARTKDSTRNAKAELGMDRQWQDSEKQKTENTKTLLFVILTNSFPHHSLHCTPTWSRGKWSERSREKKMIHAKNFQSKS